MATVSSSGWARGSERSGRRPGRGGFRLALKFVPLAEDVGPVELRSLQIIKEIRHPHLLSMFGSWQVNQYLIIGMELAERTLLDRYRDAVGQGFPGIPAPEIFEHFLDAARAIDFLRLPERASPPLRVGRAARDPAPRREAAEPLARRRQREGGGFRAGARPGALAGQPHRQHDPGLRRARVLRPQDVDASPTSIRSPSPIAISAGECSRFAAVSRRSCPGTSCTPPTCPCYPRTSARWSRAPSLRTPGTAGRAAGPSSRRSAPPSRALTPPRCPIPGPIRPSWAPPAQHRHVQPPWRSPRPPC